MSNRIALIALTGNQVEQTAIALERVWAFVPFTPIQTLLISPEKPNAWGQAFSWAKCGKLSRNEYEDYHVRRIIEHVHPDADFVLTIQADSGISKKEAWTDEFLGYDFIGSPWPLNYTEPENRVGNDGFCLRSHAWLERAVSIPARSDETVGPLRNSDVWQFRTHKSHFTDAGLRVAPLELAARFGFEHRCEDVPGHSLATSFGWHGIFNMKQPA